MGGGAEGGGGEGSAWKQTRGDGLSKLRNLERTYFLNVPKWWTKLLNIVMWNSENLIKNRVPPLQNEGKLIASSIVRRECIFHTKQSRNLFTSSLTIFRYRNCNVKVSMKLKFQNFFQAFTAPLDLACVILPLRKVVPYFLRSESCLLRWM